MKRLLLAAAAALVLSFTLFSLRHQTSLSDAYTQYRASPPRPPSAPQ
ncbi:MAG TPA: hypothetical protein PKA30_16745 [Accumulibacter sp.]|nr:hypothetical protein [Accumulibacter sp.]MDS4016396.1 hypothetical protein [Accumulibacter sp.]MDS4055839.1 hypothetical protein [Accumulibacter sp.]HMV07178.1 hypothetical protein [Accumulibacter sp.]HMW62559.1 hypothetical protein [Accumulibacter sp.]HMW81212.1 hypothetical protein [Accumulibacter sp.]